ncbi:MAG TPA: cupin-like domain-containing protein [Nannocystis sp.]
MLANLTLPAGYFDPSPIRAARCGAFWFGPAGTVTALHHDTSNILFFQVVGRKRYRLYPRASPRCWPTPAASTTTSTPSAAPVTDGPR